RVQLVLARIELGERESALRALRRIEAEAVLDRQQGTAFWRSGPREAHGVGEVETTSALLSACMAVHPETPLAPMAMKWLVSRRDGAMWTTTRQTAAAAYALADYLRVTRELAPEYAVTVEAGEERRSLRVTPGDPLSFENRLVVPEARWGADGP